MDQAVILAPIFITNVVYALDNDRRVKTKRSVLWIWNLIHLAMGFFLHRMIHTKPKHYHLVLAMSLINLFVNSIWTTVAMGEKANRRMGIYLTILLLANVFIMNALIVNDTIGRLLMVPYFTWLVYALHQQMG